MKLPDDNSASMWEQIAAKPKKRGPGGKVTPGMKQHTLKKQREDADPYADVRLNLALHGVLNADGGWKF